MNTTQTTSPRTHYRIESRRTDGRWEQRAATVSLDRALAALRSWADEQPGLNWRVASGDPFGESLEVHTVRGAVR